MNFLLFFHGLSPSTFTNENVSVSVFIPSMWAMEGNIISGRGWEQVLIVLRPCPIQVIFMKDVNQ